MSTYTKALEQVNENIIAADENQQAIASNVYRMIDQRPTLAKISSLMLAVAAIIVLSVYLVIQSLPAPRDFSKELEQMFSAVVAYNVRIDDIHNELSKHQQAFELLNPRPTAPLFASVPKAKPTITSPK